jgi:hypothetical protein
MQAELLCMDRFYSGKSRSARLFSNIFSLGHLLALFGQKRYRSILEP